MAKTVYIKKGLTGGGSSDLDAVDGSTLAHDDVAFVFTGGSFYIYKLNDNSTVVEDSPYVITPDTNSTTKRWELHDPAPRTYTKTMSSNEEFQQDKCAEKTFFLTPNGTGRTFNPTGSFTAGFRAHLINMGSSYPIIFDSTALNQTVLPGDLGLFYFTGSTWH